MAPSEAIIANAHSERIAALCQDWRERKSRGCGFQATKGRSNAARDTADQAIQAAGTASRLLPQGDSWRINGGAPTGELISSMIVSTFVPWMLLIWEQDFS
jgi:hypothetical protein